jgi:hypothetical protein
VSDNYDGPELAAKILRQQAEIERLRAALANEQARGVHTCHEHCERPMCVMQRAITERDSIIERLRARLAEAERDAVRYRWLEQWINENTSGFEIFPIGPGNEYGPDGNTIIDVNFYYLADEKWPVKTLDDAIDAAMGKP